MKKWERYVCVVLLICGVLINIVWYPLISDAAERGSLFWYYPKGGVIAETSRLSDALEACREDGGTVVIRSDYILGAGCCGDFVYIPYGVRLVIPDGICMVLKDVRIRLDGLIHVEGDGILDLSEGEGTISGDGDIRVEKRAHLYRRIPKICKEGEICLVGEDIEKGKSLSSSQIRKDRVRWNTAVEGEWSFAQPGKVPETGTGLYDVIFTPRNKWTYQPVTFYRCGMVTVWGKSSETIPAAEAKPEPDKDPSAKQEKNPDSGATQTKGTENNGSAKLEKTSGQSVTITRMAARPSSIYRVVRSFAQKRPRIRKAVRGRDRKTVYLYFSPVSGKTGYEIQYTSCRILKRVRKIRTKRRKAVLRGLKKKKQYYIRIRAYREKKKRRTCSRWSPLIKVR